MKQEYRNKKNRRSESGLSMLEYAAGAAVLIGIVYIAMNTFGQSLGGFIDGLSTWLNDKTNDVVAAP